MNYKALEAVGRSKRAKTLGKSKKISSFSFPEQLVLEAIRFGAKKSPHHVELRGGVLGGSEQ